MLRHKSFARFITSQENRSAFLAVQDLVHNIASGKSQRSPSPLFLHGPPGTGKSHLASGLVKELAGSTGLTIHCGSAADFREPTHPRLDTKKLAASESAHMPVSVVESSQQCDLLVVEDLQHLPPAAHEAFVQIVDYRQAHQRPMVFTASVGPRHLAHRGTRFPAPHQSPGGGSGGGPGTAQSHQSRAFPRRTCPAPAAGFKPGHSSLARTPLDRGWPPIGRCHQPTGDAQQGGTPSP